MSLGATLPVTRGQVKRAIRESLWKTLKQNWESGGINMADLNSYLRVIHEGNFPTAEPLLVEPTEETIEAFKNYVETKNIPSYKPPGSFSGLEGLEGFLKSVWNTVKGAVGGVVKIAASAVGLGPKAEPIVVQPTVQIPSGAVQMPVTPAAAETAIGAILKNPIFLALVGVGLVLALKK